MAILAKGLKVSLLIVPTLMATTLLAQGPGGFPGPRPGFDGKNHTPPTPAQLAAGELTMIARSLKLDSAQTSALTGDAPLVADLTAEQTTLQANAATVRTASGKLATDIATGNIGDEPTQELAIGNANSSSLAARVTAAGQVLAALPSVGITLSSTQTANLARMLTGGGFGR